MTIRRCLAGCYLALAAAGAVAAEDKIYLDETVISGNQELPKVLYILPWREPEGEPVPATAPRTVVRPSLQPVYPHEYRRALRYRQAVLKLKPANED